LIWWKGFAGIWSWPANPDEWLSELVVRSWAAVLTLFQIVSLLLLIGALGLAFGVDEGDSGGGRNFTG
jgi:hypothetical protein